MSELHFLTVGAPQIVVENLWQRIADTGKLRFSHLVHPGLNRSSWAGGKVPGNVHFFSDAERPQMPPADPALLASLEREDVPTLHNMILGDRVVSKASYPDALRYATFLVQCLMRQIGAIAPTAVIGAFDALHGSLGLAVARRLNIPWFALNFSVIPTGYACFCDRMTPAARVLLEAADPATMRVVAEKALQEFETRRLQAPAYIAPAPASVLGKVVSLPKRMHALGRTLRKSTNREFLRFVEVRSGHDVGAALNHYRRAFAARSAIAEIPTLTAPPATPYAFFALHMQPESSIDVWAPFCANQMWVIELLSRSLPPTHKLLVKIHKSDVANYSREQLGRMRSFPGVEIVAPFADTRRILEGMDLLFSIQGTVGLEAALLGKPVIALADSPVKCFPSVEPIGRIEELPALVRRMIGQSPPARQTILDAYAHYLGPFLPAGHNNWTVRRSDDEIPGYVRLFQALGRSLHSPLRQV